MSQVMSNGLFGCKCKCNPPTKEEIIKELESDIVNTIRYSLEAMFKEPHYAYTLKYFTEEPLAESDKLNGLMENKIQRVITNTVGRTIIDKASEYVKGEEFIDNIVSRIKNKQL